MRTITHSVSAFILVATLAVSSVRAGELPGRIDFESLVPGKFVTTVEAHSPLGPIGPVVLSALNNAFAPEDNTGIILDSGDLPPGFAELGTPNEDFGGPGVGDGGSAGSFFENSVPLGKVFAINQSTLDEDGDGFADELIPANHTGLGMCVDFREIVTPWAVDTVTLRAVTVISAEGPTKIRCYDLDDNKIAEIDPKNVGVNGVRHRYVNVPGVAYIHVIVNDLAAIDNVLFGIDGVPTPTDLDFHKSAWWRKNTEELYTAIDYGYGNVFVTGDRNDSGRLVDFLDNHDGVEDERLYLKGKKIHDGYDKATNRARDKLIKELAATLLNLQWNLGADCILLEDYDIESPNPDDLTVGDLVDSARDVYGNRHALPEQLEPYKKALKKVNRLK